MQTIAFLDLIQQDPAVFNANQKQKREEFIKEFGKEAVNKILYGNKHHDLKASRNTDYRLNDAELNTLKIDKLFFKQSDDSFTRSFLNLYNNDMPVMITSDSMLFALHKFYDTYLKNLEETKLSTDLIKLCDLMLNSLYSITPTKENMEYLKGLEVYFMIPKVLLNLKNEMPEKISSETKSLFSIEETKSLFSNPSKERIEEELKLYPKPDNKINHNAMFADYEKKEAFINFIKPNCKSYEAGKFIRESPKLNAAFQYFSIPDVNEPIILKYGGEELFNSLIESIAKKSDIEMDLCGVNIKIMGSLFTCRGHYTESLQLKNYFRAFTWISKFDVTIEKNSSMDTSGVVLASILSKIAEPNVSEIDNFQIFIQKIIGSGDSYSIKNYLELLNKHVPKSNLDDSISYILSNAELLLNNIMSENLKKSTLTKFGEKDGESKSISFSLINKGIQVDNEIIEQFVDNNLLDNDGDCPKRKFPSIFDLVYTLFNNKDVLPQIKECMHDENIEYDAHLENVKNKYENHEFDNTCYAQELKMLIALVADKENIKTSPFNTQAWGQKQAKAQIGHYAELRHDNCLYVEESCGIMCECMFPDLMVEPVLTFWKEMLNMVFLMKSLLVDATKRDSYILDNFEKVLVKFILVTDAYLNGNKIDENILEELKAVCKEQHMGSGGPSYTGWYMSLFHNAEESLDNKPECGTWFTAVNDERGPGGIETIGNSGTNLMYVLVTDNNNQTKVLLAPTYNTYSFKTAYGERLNDENFAEKIKDISPLIF